MRAVVERELRPRDGAHAEGGRGVGQRHGAVETVVVGEGERGVALLRGGHGELERVGGAVEEGEGGVAVELDVGHERMFAREADGADRAATAARSHGVTYGLPMTRPEAEALRTRLAREHVDRVTHDWLTQRTATGEWRVVKVPLPAGARRGPLGSVSEARPRPPHPDDPRPSHARDMGPGY